VYRLGKPTRSLAGSILVELPRSSGPVAAKGTSMAPEFTCHGMRRWVSELGTRTVFFEPGSPWENGYIKSFKGKLRDELLNREIFYTLQEAQVLIERWRNQYNRRRPHSALGNRPPASEANLVPSLGSPLTTAAAFGQT
jgi:putative transposase